MSYLLLKYIHILKRRAAFRRQASARRFTVLSPSDPAMRA